MTRYMILAGLLIIAACKSKTKTTDDGEKKTTDTVITALKDTVSVKDSSIGKVDMENFGPLKLGEHYSHTQEFIGAPEKETKPIEWGADGLMHSDWTWKSLGLVLNMSAEKEKETETWSIFSIAATSPCDFKTKAGLGIGSSYAEVEAAYKKDIDKEATDKTQITVGSVYGGIIFSFKNDKVNKIFLGAAAE